MPDRISSTVSHVAAYPDGSMLAQASAARVAASRTAALPVSVRRNRRSGVSSRRAHTVRGENWEGEAPGSVTSRFSRAPLALKISEPAGERECCVTRFRGPRRLSWPCERQTYRCRTPPATAADASAHAFAVVVGFRSQVRAAAEPGQRLPRLLRAHRVDGPRRPEPFRARDSANWPSGKGCRIGPGPGRGGAPDSGDGAGGAGGALGWRPSGWLACWPGGCPGCGLPGSRASRLTRSPGARVMPGSGSRRVWLSRTVTGIQPGGQVVSPSALPAAGKPAEMVISRIW